MPFAFGGPAGKGRIRAEPADFVVTEELSFALKGEGEHLFLRLRETGCNTAWVAGQLARWAGRPRHDVGYAGLKDRHAVTEQWFSVLCPGGRHPDPAALMIEGVELLEWRSHDRKLKRGALRGNTFRLRVTGLEADPGLLEPRLRAIATRGVPNAFGPQRFGREQGNLRLAERWFSGELRPRRDERGFALSAARSLIFNAVLAARISAGSWETAAAGDPVQLDGSGSWFIAEAGDDALPARLAALDVHPTGPLWGQGEPPGHGPGAELERVVAARFPLFAAGLAAHGLEQERRSLRLRVAELAWRTEDDVLELSFSLPAGAFATAVLRELLDVD
ncbi:tRNA pseudouridine(13) synthase TruD [Thioalkalivibrio sp. XN279]|uniref:tRNA pseudouridine(13) synthase TruD n=1 Tax=Thioalkalivibrio sp. XN279 TaxID=2714953 RepID=UPI00140CF07E|nr:tRNA pseudouridine(13) synthase TruD [Thioalkalivibrio sp. XN279]NHA15279.1 tRNA pseudouridine(13) synthase TruD [Thioalkalivibrio sp. XN279]